MSTWKELCDKPLFGMNAECPRYKQISQEDFDKIRAVVDGLSDHYVFGGELSQRLETALRDLGVIE